MTITDSPISETRDRQLRIARIAGIRYAVTYGLWIATIRPQPPSTSLHRGVPDHRAALRATPAGRRRGDRGRRRRQPRGPGLAREPAGPAPQAPPISAAISYAVTPGGRDRLAREPEITRSSGPAVAPLSDPGLPFPVEAARVLSDQYRRGTALAGHDRALAGHDRALAGHDGPRPRAGRRHRDGHGRPGPRPGPDHLWLEADGATLLLVGGNGHPVGRENDTAARVHNLHTWARAGISPSATRTGGGRPGMANGAAAGRALAAEVLGSGTSTQWETTRFRVWSMPLDYPLHERTLGNGLRVVVSPDHSVPTVTVNMWVNVGSRHEVAGRTGFAHLFEHLMFQGSRQVASGEHFSLLMGQGGRLNATTWFDRTNYFETIPVGALDLALWLEADRHGFLLDAVNQTNLDNQRDVVKEEKRQRYDNAPYGNAMRDIYATVFPEGHPYHHPTIGSMADLDAASVEDVHAFFEAHYRPDNTVLTIVGDIEPEDAFARAERFFAGLPERAGHTRPNLPQLPPLTEPVRLDVVEDLPNDRLHIAFRLPADSDPDFLAADLAIEAFAGLSMSRLVRRLVREEQVANSVQGHAMGFVDGVSLGLIAIDLAEDADPAAVEEVFLAELARFRGDGPSPVEMEAALAQAERSWLQALASQEERADLISHYALLHGDAGYINTLLDRYAAITADDVRRVSDTWLAPGARAVVSYLARDNAEAA